MVFWGIYICAHMCVFVSVWYICTYACTECQSLMSHVSLSHSLSTVLLRRSSLSRDQKLTDRVGLRQSSLSWDQKLTDRVGWLTSELQGSPCLWADSTSQACALGLWLSTCALGILRFWCLCVNGWAISAAPDLFYMKPMLLIVYRDIFCH